MEVPACFIRASQCRKEEDGGGGRLQPSTRIPEVTSRWTVEVSEEVVTAAADTTGASTDPSEGPEDWRFVAGIPSRKFSLRERFWCVVPA